MSLLPPVVAELRGNVSDLSAKLSTARSEISQTVDHGTSRFGALSNVSRQTWTAIGGAATLAGGAMIAISDRLESAHVRLETAVKNTGASYDDFKGQISGVDSKMESLGFTNSDVETGLGTLTTALGDTNAAIKFSGDVADIARFKHESYGQAARQVALLSQGSARATKDLGIQVDTTALKHAQGADKIALMGQVMEQVHVKIGGQAAAYTHTLGGEIDHLKAVVTDYVERNGKAFGEVLSGAGMAIFGIAQAAPIARAAIGGLGEGFSLLAAAIGTYGIGTVALQFASWAAPIAGATFLLSQFVSEWEKAHKEGATTFAQWNQGLGELPTNIEGVRARLDEVSKKHESLSRQAHEYDLTWGGIGNTISGLADGKSLNEMADQHQKLKGAAEAAGKEEDNLRSILRSLDQQSAASGGIGTQTLQLQGYGRQLTVTQDQASSFANQLGIDLTKGQTSFDALGKKVEDTQGKLAGAFSKMGLDGNAWANTVLSQNGNVLADDDKLAASVDKVAKAYGGLGPAALTSGQQLAAMGATGKLTADQLDAISGEAQKLRDGMASSFGSATSIVQAFATGTIVTKDQFSKSLKDMNAEAHHWADDLKAATAAGVDQGLLSELAQAGPKATNILDGLLADVKAGNLNQINQTVADTNTQLSSAQGAMLSYETPFYIAGQTIGTAGANGVGGGLGGAIANAQNTAIAAAAAMNEASKFFATAGANDIAAYNNALAAGFSQEKALLAGELSQMAVPRLPGAPRGGLYFAEGGIIDRLTPNATLGERGREVVIPLYDQRRAAELAEQSGLMSLLSGASGGSVAPMNAGVSAGPVAAGAGPTIVVQSPDVYVVLDGAVVGKAVSRSATTEARLFKRNNVNAGLS